MRRIVLGLSGLALAALLSPELPAYLTAGPVVVTALAAHRRGDHDEAHRLLETARQMALQL